MALVDGYLPRIEPFLVFCLLLSILEDHDGFNVSVGCSVVKEGILTRVNFFELAPVFYQLYKAVIVPVSDGDHRGSFLELVMRSIGQYLFLEEEVHNVCVPSARQ
jgi:hypothetical protein